MIWPRRCGLDRRGLKNIICFVNDERIKVVLRCHVCVQQCINLNSSGIRFRRLRESILFLDIWVDPGGAHAALMDMQCSRWTCLSLRGGPVCGEIGCLFRRIPGVRRDTVRCDITVKPGRGGGGRCHGGCYLPSSEPHISQLVS